jgi:phospholipid/cholesterol/gamma-HCH transport system permease protein
MLKTVRQVGEVVVFLGKAVAALSRLPGRKSLFFLHCEYIGVTSTGIVVVAAIFLGAVIGYQFYIGFAFIGAEELMGGTVGVSLFRELASVMTAIMVTGRAGAAMAAEIASMRISEQIDALEVMAVDPIEYLVTPRIAAALTMVPVLAVLFAGVSSMSAAFIACSVMGLSYPIYWDQFTLYVDEFDILHLLSKAAVFGFFMALLGCFYGFRAGGGARAVGVATKTTVVMTLLTILSSDYILTALLPNGASKLIAD